MTFDIKLHIIYSRIVVIWKYKLNYLLDQKVYKIRMKSPNDCQFLIAVFALRTYKWILVHINILDTELTFSIKMGNSVELIAFFGAAIIFSVICNAFAAPWQDYQYPPDTNYSRWWSYWSNFKGLIIINTMPNKLAFNFVTTVPVMSTPIQQPFTSRYPTVNNQRKSFILIAFYSKILLLNLIRIKFFCELKKSQLI